MNLGPERKKIAILGALVVVGGYVFYANVLSGPDTPASSPKPAAKQAPAAAQKSPTQPPNVRRAKVPVRGAASQEFKPSLPKPEERPDYAKIDPTLRLDLLAKVQSVNPEGGSRSLFQFAPAPPPKPVETAAVVKPAPRIIGPEPPPKPAAPAKPPEPPPPPPITLKVDGFSKPKP